MNRADSLEMEIEEMEKRTSRLRRTLRESEERKVENRRKLLLARVALSERYLVMSSLVDLGESHKYQGKAAENLEEAAFESWFLGDYRRAATLFTEAGELYNRAAELTAPYEIGVIPKSEEGVNYLRRVILETSYAGEKRKCRKFANNTRKLAAFKKFTRGMSPLKKRFVKWKKEIRDPYL